MYDFFFNFDSKLKFFLFKILIYFSFHILKMNKYSHFNLITLIFFVCVEHVSCRY